MVTGEGTIPSPPLSISVGTSSKEILKRSNVKNRIELVITNTSSSGQVISLAFGDNVTAIDGSGIVLQPKERFSAAQDARYDVINTAINAVSSAASGSVAIHVRSE